MNDAKRTVYVDTETTGLNPKTNAILELAIIDDAGEVLLQSLVNPWPHKEWAEAQAIHGISPEMVRHAPLLHDLWPIVFRIIQGARVVFFNAEYDRYFFPNGQLMYCEIQCAMLRMAGYLKIPSTRGSGYRWPNLKDAAAHVGHKWEGKAHRAAADAQAARSVWKYLEAKEMERKVNPSEAVSR